MFFPIRDVVASKFEMLGEVIDQDPYGRHDDDAKLANFTRESLFKTVVGDVKFGKGGGWSQSRVLQVQYQNIKSADLAEFKDARTQAAVWPLNLASGTFIYPYAKAKRSV